MVVVDLARDSAAALSRKARPIMRAAMPRAPARPTGVAAASARMAGSTLESCHRTSAAPPPRGSAATPADSVMTLMSVARCDMGARAPGCGTGAAPIGVGGVVSR
ncbi:hypothetical protein P405_17490 [Streptomyces sp. FR-008]|nr:hypothetical protein P405_17490 [Streptomyces sp. FR-008]